MVPAGVEADVFRVIQSSPGVTITGDVTSRFYVRGGGSDQNLILLNGTPVYNPYHALGVFSIIDPEIISVLEFYKGGFPPEYGGRLSSILNIVTRDGNKNFYEASAYASLLSGKLLVEGPVPDGSFILTGRKSYHSSVLKNYLRDKQAPFDFYDVTFKANYTNPSFDKNSKFTVHSFLSADQVRNNDPLQEDYSLSNNLVGINWQKVWSSPLFSLITLSYSGFSAEVFPNFSNSKPRKNDVSEITGDFNFNYVYENKDQLGFGLQNKIISTELQLINLFGNKFIKDQSGWDMSIYGNYKFFRWENVGLDLGMRARLIAASEKRPFLFEPRLSITYMPLPVLALRASFGRYSQETATLTDENELITIFEPWVIIPEYLSAPQSTHYIAGLKYYLSEFSTIEVEGYYKLITNLIETNDKKFSAADYDYISADGESYGIEFLCKLQSSSFFLKTAYSAGWAFKFRKGGRIPPRFDIRHSANILLGFDLGYGWSASTSWMFSSGMPFTPVAGFFDRLEIDALYPPDIFGNYLPVVLWGFQNSKRLPVYHRLDLGITKKFRLFLADMTVGFSILNIYDRKNIFYFKRDTGEKVYMLPFLPSVSVKAEL